ncbi:MAG TPA: hypothetical protein VFU76_09150 [Terriglobales bacterium]|nr:hypothetical protein [Terriglobales bacterium]
MNADFHARDVWHGSSTRAPGSETRAPQSLRGWRRTLCVVVLALALSGLLASPHPTLLPFVKPVRVEA